MAAVVTTVYKEGSLVVDGWSGCRQDQICGIVRNAVVSNAVVSNAVVRNAVVRNAVVNAVVRNAVSKFYA